MNTIRIDGVAWDNDNSSAKLAEKAFPLQAVCVVLVLGLLSSVVFCHENFFNCLGKRKLFQHGKDWRLGKGLGVMG